MGLFSFDREPKQPAESIDPSTTEINSVELTELAEIPKFARMLTIEDAELALTNAHASHLAAVQIDLNRPEILILHTPDCESTQLSMLKMNAQRAGYRINETFVVSQITLTQLYGRQGSTENTLSDTDADQSFQKIMDRAIELGTSDIRIIYGRDHGIVRYEVDKQWLTAKDVYPRNHADAIIRSLWARCHESSKSPTLPPYNIEDASMLLSHRDRQWQLRFHYHPTIDGAEVILRLLELDQQGDVPTLEELGYEPQAAQLLRNAFSKEAGCVVFCGTTSSGKTTTIRSAIYHEIMQRHAGRLQIITIEDPVEYRITGDCISQIQLTTANRKNEGHHMTYASAAKGCLRSNPNVVMIGEIRDSETLKVASDLALTGRLVPTTFHAEDIEACLLRFHKLGLSTAELGSRSFLSAIIGQALIPKLCQHCKVNRDQVDFDDPAFLIRLSKQFTDQTGLRFRGSGCEHCNGLGVKGKIPAYEIFMLNEPIRQALLEGQFSKAYNIWRQQYQERPHSVMGRTRFECALPYLEQGIVDPRDAERAIDYMGSNGSPTNTPMSVVRSEHHV